MAPNAWIKDFAARSRDVIFLVRNDRDVRAAFRLMIFTVAAALLAFHAARQFIIMPMEKKLERLAAEISEAEAEASALAASSQAAVLLEQMQRRKTAAEEDIRKLETELGYRRRHWRACGDTAAFNRVIFTTGPAAPFRFDRSLSGMSRAEARSDGPFLLHPVRLSGTAPFRELIAYLAFLETRPEVGGIEAMSMGRTPKGMVNFSLTITRRELADRGEKG